MHLDFGVTKCTNLSYFSDIFGFIIHFNPFYMQLDHCLYLKLLYSAY